MNFGPVPPAAARGGILAHSLRLPDGRRLRKGLRLGPDEVALLEGAGVEEVTVALLDPADVGEDEAAERVARALAGPGTEVRPPGTGRCNVIAAEAGVFAVDARRIRRVNEVDESIGVSTLGPEVPVHPGDLLATVKVIPFAAPAEVVARCEAVAADGHALGVAPFRRVRAALVLTTGPGTSGSVHGKAPEVLRGRIAALGGSLEMVAEVGHTPHEVRGALEEALAAGAGLVLVLGSSAVGDRNDVVPAAVRAVGGEILRLGIPVDPGNLTLLARCGDVPVLGVPGCARSPRRNGFDWILERVVAGRGMAELDLSGLGVGGLLKEPAQRPQPRRPRRSGRGDGPRVAGVILAAGRSTRMGEVNKLLAEVGGVPMVRRVAETVRSAALEPVIVVLGHEAEAVRAALEGLPVEFVVNPAYAAGMGTSVARGIEAVADRVDGAMVVLGDMPWIDVRHMDALVEAFAPEDGRGICAPVVDRKRG
ncbi:MAG TPA: molybdopterin-binding/glycosyltransferase family 2 protein, partial [Longimicrobiales bacterium]|nr:molybdopterin-binding/glycosyltransferase family 2 protein [Longimicrobiales bacterium]